MERLSKLTEELAKRLQTAPGFEKVTVVTAYSGCPAPAVLSEAAVVVEQGAVTVKGSALGDFLSRGKGKRVNMTVRFTFLIPIRDGAERAASLFVSLCRAVLFEEEYAFLSMSTGALKQNTAKNAYEMVATGVLETELYKEEGIE